MISIAYSRGSTVNTPPETPPRRVVVAPDVVAKSFLVPECRTVLELWRDARIQLVVTRELLVVYLKVLRDLGIPDAQLHRWAIWFTANDKTVFLSEPNFSGTSVREILHDAASRGNAEAIVSTETAPDVDTAWILVDDFLPDYSGYC
jgi:hypothetical protein